MFKWLFSFENTLVLVALLFPDHWQPMRKIFLNQDHTFFFPMESTIIMRVSTSKRSSQCKWFRLILLCKPTKTSYRLQKFPNIYQSLNKTLGLEVFSNVTKCSNAYQDYRVWVTPSSAEPLKVRKSLLLTLGFHLMPSKMLESSH